MSLLVDTSVWSLAFRRDGEQTELEVAALREALLNAHRVVTTVTTGTVVQELLQGVTGARDRAQMLERLSAIDVVQPDLEDHVEAADVRNGCG